MNIAYILILLVHVGPMGTATSNSNALTVAEFTTQERCNIAGQTAKKMVEGTVKRMEFVCLPK